MKLKKLVLVLLLLCLMVGALVFSASAAMVIDSGTCGENLSWTLDDEGTLTISGTGEMDDYNTSDRWAPWHSYAYQMKRIKINEGVTSIGDCAFFECGVSSVSLPNTLKRIGNSAFNYCLYLYGITIPEGVTSIGNNAFYFCEFLYYVEMPDSLISIGDGAFRYCKQLGKIDIPQSVTSIGNNAFNYCISLSDITFKGNVPQIGENAFYNVEATAYYFDGVSSWTDEVMQNYGGSIAWVAKRGGICGDNLVWTLDSEGMLTISGTGAIYEDAFTGNRDIKSAVIEEGVTGIGMYAFTYCENMTGIQLPKSLTSIGGLAFQYCSGLTSIEIPEGVTEIPSATFTGCSSLAKIKFPTSINYLGFVVFDECANLTSITFIGDAPQFEAATFSDITATAYYPKGNTTWIEAVRQSYGGNITWVAEAEIVDNGTCGDNLTWKLDSEGTLTISGIGIIWEGAFVANNEIKTVVIEDGVTGIGNAAFLACESLTNIYIPNSVISIDDEAFCLCTGLKSIEIPDSVISIGEYAFGECYSLTSVTLGESVNKIGRNAFWSCLSLNEITFNGDAPEIGANAFGGNNSGVIATAYYPANNATWTEDVMQDYGGDITWVRQGGGYEPVAVVTQPTSVAVAEGTTAKVIVQATGDGLTYKWYFKNPGASKFTLTTSFTGNTYSVAMNASRSGRQVYCVITDQYGNKVQTNTVTLSMASPVKITTQPTSVTAAEGKTATVTVQATGDGLTYKWYYKNAGASKFTLTTTFTGNTYTAEMNATRNGRQVYCVITDQYGNKVQTKTVTLTMASPVKITAQPTSVTTAEGKTATVTVKATGDGLTYKWYYKNAGASKFSLTTSFTGNTYSVEMSASRNGRQVYCVITDQYGNKVQTKTVTLTMSSPVKITAQPTSVTVAEGKTATVTVKATGDGLTYKWYFKNPGASKFSLTTSFTGNTYSVSMSESRNGRQIYCVITDKYGNEVKTNTVTLSMTSGIVITQQPKSVAVAANETAKVTVKATGEGLTYQWYIKNPGKTTFSKSSVTSATYAVKMTSSNSGRQIYCVITDANGNTVRTETVTLKIK